MVFLYSHANLSYKIVQLIQIIQLIQSLFEWDLKDRVESKTGEKYS